MAFYQVVENMNAPSGKGVVQLSGSTSVGAEAALAAAQAAQQTADEALPKVGGTLTGSLTTLGAAITLQNAAPRLFLDSTIADRTLVPTTNSEILSVPFRDKNQRWLGVLDCYANNAGQSTHIRAYQRTTTTDVTASLGITCLHGGGAFGYCTAHPRANNYGTDIVTMKAMKDYALGKQSADVTLFVNAETGSDTADLFAGRGFSKEMPFCGLDAAVIWARTNLAGIFSATIMLCSDISLPNWLTLYANNIRNLIITSDSPDTKRTIHFTGGGSLLGSTGSVVVRDLKFETSTAENFIKADGLCQFFIGTGVEFSGTVSGAALLSTRSAQMFAPYEITGTVTGKKYEVASNAFLQTYGKLDQIPGTIAGTCDATSKVA